MRRLTKISKVIKESGKLKETSQVLGIVSTTSEFLRVFSYSTFGCVHIWWLDTGALALAQDSVAFRLWYSKYPSTICEYFEKMHVHISAKRAKAPSVNIAIKYQTWRYPKTLIRQQMKGTYEFVEIAAMTCRTNTLDLKR